MYYISSLYNSHSVIDFMRLSQVTEVQIVKEHTNNLNSPRIAGAGLPLSSNSIETTGGRKPIFSSSFFTSESVLAAKDQQPPLGLSQGCLESILISAKSEICRCGCGLGHLTCTGHGVCDNTTEGLANEGKPEHQGPKKE